MYNQPNSLESVVKSIVPVDQTWIDKAKERSAQLLMPYRALGKLHVYAEKLCGIYKTLSPKINRKSVIIMAGDHGVAQEGVSAYPQDVTGAMVQTFLHGGAGINAFARKINADVWVVDTGIIPDIQINPHELAKLDKKYQIRIEKVGKGTANMTKVPAMTLEQAEQSVMTGFRIASEMIATGVELFATGDMGIGNTTPSAAIGAVIIQAPIDKMVGRGTGIDDERLVHKKKMITQSISLHQPDRTNALDVLSKIGGFEIGGIAGVILAGAYHQRPVVIDGLISTAGALIAHTLCPHILDYVFSGHCSEEPGHQVMLQYLNLEPILNLGMRLGEGTGAALAMGIIDSAVAMFTEMMTFDQMYQMVGHT
ncbi:MAG: nicotinate-nucleotide--dimethylbenzimidazole phosphoribosyltransferase [Desulfobacterales bacterium]|nr:nicotinate-nucleotide--dimethylbenzimidazole phosphoribosyltransferase [Desulfobacterales bacterium]